MDEIWLDLANAIILQAVHDYRKARVVLKQYPNNAEALAMITDVESFFHSEWFNKLCALDGVSLLDRLKAEEI